MIVAIDGPAGSGKSTIAKLLAKKLAYVYLDTGAMYRALTLKSIWEDVENTDEENLIKLASSLDFHFDPDGKVFLDGKDVTDDIRTQEIIRRISPICTIAEVRDSLVDLQRKIAGESDVVTEGRDTTTVGFVNAEVKIYLCASVQERAERRLKDFQAKGIDTDLETVKADVEKRDHADMSREIGPLKKADDAYELDTTSLTIDQVVDAIMEQVNKVNG